MTHPKRAAAILVLSGLAMLLIAALFVPKVSAEHVFPPPQDLPEHSLLASSLVIAGESASIPDPALDTCQHCHLTGSLENLWTPFWRWTVTSIFVLTFIFGAYQTSSVWRSRKPWQSIWIRGTTWLDERYQIVEPVKKALTKPVPLFSTRWMYCLGGITFMLFVIQAVTGIMLAFYYEPSPGGAYASIQYIESEVFFGSSIRSIHHWAANAMIIMVVAHLIRVFISGAFKPPRELNWVSGVFLFLLTILFGFTGYLLPWDQRAYWATTVGTEIAGGIPQIGSLALVFLRGGWDVTAITLSRFYALHVMVLPILTLALLGTHFLMIRRQGIARPL